MKRKEEKIIGTHWRPDVDAIAAIYLLQTYGGKEKTVNLFLREGDVSLISAPLMGVTLLDRGRGKFDHHGRNTEGETSASLVAKELGLTDEGIQRLLAKVRRADLQGESLPFDISDLIKCMQRCEASNEEIIELGKKLVKDNLEFSKKKLARNNKDVKKIIESFLSEKEIVPPKFQRYLENLSNSRFERPFDLAEILGVEGEDANDFLLKLLDFEYRDSINYLIAIKEVRKAWKKVVRGVTIVVDISDNLRFKEAARNKQNALITIQRRPNGQTGVYFDTKRIQDEIIEALVAMIRLEECLIQGRPVPKVDLRQPEWIEEVPEWYYFKAPEVPGKKIKPGRFFLNGSLTAPDVPPSKIPIDTLRYIAEKAMLYQPFNWMKWQSERLAYYSKKQA